MRSRVRHTARAAAPTDKQSLPLPLGEGWGEGGAIDPEKVRAARLTQRTSFTPPAMRVTRAPIERRHVILYRLIPDGVQIVRVLHGARHLDRLLFSEGME